LASLTRPVALLRLQPEELSARIGIQFQPAHDDLDMLDWARVVGLSGRPYALVRHRHSPEPGTQILVRSDSSDLWQDVVDVLKDLQLSERDPAWTAPEAVPARPGGTDQKRTRAVRQTPRKLHLKVPATVSTRLRNVQGRGGFHSLLRKLQRRVRGTELAVTPDEIEKLLGYSAEIGTSSPRRSHRTAPKKAARKK